MPDLSLEASHQFWADYHDKMIYRVVVFMEQMEDWTYDGVKGFESAIRNLGRELDDIQMLDMSQLGHEDYFVDIASNAKASRGLRLLQAIDTVHPGSASKLLMYAEEKSTSPTDMAGLFIRRNIVFERLRLLGRVFSRERITMVMRSIEGDESEL